MTIFYRSLTGTIQPISDLESEGVAATDALCEDGFALDIAGGDLTRLRSGNAPILKSHDPGIVVGRITGTRVTATRLFVRWKYPTPGISAQADECREMVKDGFYTLSIGFAVTESRPVDPQRPREGRRATKWTAYEVSLVGVAADVGAVVTTRSLSRSGKVLSAANADILRTAHDHAHRAHLESQRCTGLVRRVLAAAELDEESGFMQKPQDEASRSVDFRRRQRDKLMLSLSPCIGLDRALPTLTRAQRQADARALMRSLH